MTLTKEQRQAIDSGDSVAVVIDGTPCVVVRQDVFDRVQRVIRDGDMLPEQAYPIILEAWDATGSPQDAEDYRS
jgi:hypothetical protein